LCSAKEFGKDDIVPESDYIHIGSDGSCAWWPVFGRMMSHCSIDTTWFPFDKQHCDMVFISWLYSAKQLNLSTYVGSQKDGVVLWDDYEPSGEWKWTGTPGIMFILEKRNWNA